MSSIPVSVKHAGKKHDLEIDTSMPGEVFKMQLYSLTGVEPDRQKILIKGGQLKDDTDLAKLNIKPNHVFMMMGTPSEGALKAPTKQFKFLEDMSDKDLAKVKGAIPAGLQNLGNTCYMNSTLQMLRSVPELQEELLKYKNAGGGGFGGAGSSSNPMLSFIGGGSAGGGDLTASLRDLFKQMSDTTEGFTPLMFVNTLRQVFPQFDQKDRQGRYAQQDAEECYSQILTNLRSKLKTPTDSGDKAFVDTYFSGKMQSVTKCNETDDEPAVESTDTFIKLDCHISVSINHIRDGILAGLTEEIEKKSPTLDRDAIYSKTSRISRLPKYLTCHFVRFFWKKDINKKAKIMRKVIFPFQLDATEFCTDDLRKKLIPVRDKVRNLHRDEEDRLKAKRKARTVFLKEAEVAEEREKNGENAKPEGKKDSDKMEVDDTPAPSKTPEEEEEIDWDSALAPLLDDELSADTGANQCGLYELHGIITHQGASADSGHYCSYVRKPQDEEVEEEDSNGKRKASGSLSGGGVSGAEASRWWFFNDERVTEVGWDKIEQLAGGGESHSALVLLYKAVDMHPKKHKSDKTQ